MPDTTTTLSVTPDPLKRGGSAVVSVAGGTPNSVLTVTIDNGDGTSTQLDVPLDGQGGGTATWPVPSTGWTLAKFNANGCKEVVREVT